MKEDLISPKRFLKEASILLAVALAIIGMSQAGYWVHPFIFVLSVGIVVVVPIVIVFKILMLL